MTFVLVSSFLYFFLLRVLAQYSAFESTLIPSIVSYRTSTKVKSRVMLTVVSPTFTVNA